MARFTQKLSGPFEQVISLDLDKMEDTASRECLLGEEGVGGGGGGVLVANYRRWPSRSDLLRVI